MKKVALSVAVAMALGVVVMFLPIVTYTHIFVTTDNQWLSGAENETFDRDLRVPPAEAYSVAEAAKEAPLENIDDAAQVFGRADTGPSPFPSSLFHVVLVIVMGLAAAFGASMYTRKKMRLVRSLNPPTNR